MWAEARLYDQNKGEKIMATYWHIIPQGDGYHIVCKDNDNKLYLCRKEQNNPDELIFNSKECAQNFINESMESDQYQPEKFWILEKKIIT
jgi:hypothetical protein